MSARLGRAGAKGVGPKHVYNEVLKLGHDHNKCKNANNSKQISCGKTNLNHVHKFWHSVEKWEIQMFLSYSYAHANKKIT